MWTDKEDCGKIYIAESSQGFIHGGWTVLPCKGGMPYETNRYFNVQYSTMSVGGNGTSPILGQVKKIFV